MWWTAEYLTDKKQPYYPDDFKFPECPVSALTHGRGDFDPEGLIQILGEARTVGGRGAVFALAKRDPRLYDAAAVIEHCRASESAARMRVK